MATETQLDASHDDEYSLEYFRANVKGCPNLKLFRDCVNIFGHLSSVLLTFPIKKPLETYEARYRRMESKVVSDYIMSRSNPEAVAALDSLIMEFNANLNTINDQEDFVAVEKFFKEALKIVEESQ